MARMWFVSITRAIIGTYYNVSWGEFPSFGKGCTVACQPLEVVSCKMSTGVLSLFLRMIGDFLVGRLPICSLRHLESLVLIMAQFETLHNSYLLPLFLSFLKQELFFLNWTCQVKRITTKNGGACQRVAAFLSSPFIISWIVAVLVALWLDFFGKVLVQVKSTF